MNQDYALGCYQLLLQFSSYVEQTEKAHVFFYYFTLCLHLIPCFESLNFTKVSSIYIKKYVLKSRSRYLQLFPKYLQKC